MGFCAFSINYLLIKKKKEGGKYHIKNKNTFGNDIHNVSFLLFFNVFLII